MYIRRTTKTDSKTGNQYFAFHLVESVRTNKGPRQRVLLYMGSKIDIPEASHKLLLSRIQEIISGQKSLFAYSHEIETLASTYASQLVRRLPNHCEKENLDSSEKFVTLDVNTIEQLDPRTVGTEHLLLKMAEQLSLPSQLRELGFSAREVSIALASIIARAAHPDSERGTYQWLCKSSALEELLDLNFEKVSHNRLYTISDKLLDHKDTLEKNLEIIEQEFHGYRSTIALYDLTNTYMEGQNKKNTKAKHGVSKEKRSDCPLITLGLVMNEYGFINRTSILPGNASEPKTLKEMIERLSLQEELFKPTIILDAGIATRENLAWLRENKYTYVVSAREKAPSGELKCELAPVGDLQNLVKAALVKTDDTEEQWLYCESEAKAAVAMQMKASFRKRFEEELLKVSESLKKRTGRKRFQKVLEKVGKLKEKYKSIAECYKVTVKPSEDGNTAILVDWEYIEERMDAKLTGSYYLRTNLLGVGPKELWQIYNTLRVAEDGFRFMKSSLGLRPVYHQKEHRVDGHLWITVLAYHLIHNCLYQLSKKGIHSQWKTIKSTMDRRIRVTMQAQTQDGKTFCHRSTTKAQTDQIKIYEALGISSQILKARKTTL